MTAHSMPNPTHTTRLPARLALLAALVAGGCTPPGTTPPPPVAADDAHAALNLVDHSTTTTSPANTAVATPAVSRDALRNDVYFLASERLEGRGLGTPGIDIAADFIAARFKALGLKPLPGQKDFFQTFDVTTVESAKPETSLTLGEQTWPLDKGVVPSPISADKQFTGQVVFAGYAIASGQRDYDDFAGLDVKGKVVLAMRYEPHDPKTGKSRWAENGWSGATSLESKAAAASQRGAVALIVCNPPEGHLNDDKLPSIQPQMIRPAGIPVLYVKRDVAAALLKAGGLPTLKELQTKIDTDVKPSSQPLADVTVKGTVALKRAKKPARNVMAMIPGQGPHAGEYVVIGAHYDHLGWGGPGSLMPTSPVLPRIPGVTEPANGKPADPHGTPAKGNPHAAPKKDDPHGTTKENPHAVNPHAVDPHASANPHATPPNPATATNPHAPTTAPADPRRAIHFGADDNASGTAAMLELARLYSHRPPPARTLVFLSFTAEESGLIGSGQFVNHSPVDLKKIAAMVNLDMVGKVRKNLLYVGGHGTAPGLEAIVRKADAESPLEFKNLGKGGLGPSDHMSFATKKVPVLFLFSGTHPDYHRPTDTPDKINYDGIADVVKFTASIVDQVAAAPAIEAYVDAADRESMMGGASGERSGPRRVTLGVVPSYGGDEDGKGVKIDGTSAGTPAEKAGLRQGDLLLSLGGKPTTTLQELTTAIGALKPGDKAKVVFIREGKEQSVDVTMAERK
ncbi:MAG TPA: M28 family peptidase [Tepidisphaeraceae bacterium]|nr:M28 family peptidase [Tepidisphaeraceae bacterium]